MYVLFSETVNAAKQKVLQTQMQANRFYSFNVC